MYTYIVCYIDKLGNSQTVTITADGASDAWDKVWKDFNPRSILYIEFSK